MNFTTKIPVKKAHPSIDYSSKIVSLGSCFADNMAQKFAYFKFQNTVNPFGIIFNTVAIQKLLHRVVHRIPFTENDIFFHNNLWQCFEVHSQLSNPVKEELLDNLNATLDETFNRISEATHLIITYGTSWVYRDKVSNEIVANCHKVSQSQFDKEILSVATNQSTIQNTIDLIQKINPNCSVIFTISPVRHLKDGFVENQRSKAHLISALHNLQSGIHHYFPSYEIMMDELRDYRFYADDMLHPSQTAIDYIWVQFFENYVSETEFGIMNEVCEIQRALKHRPFNPDSDNHLKFISKLNQKINRITARYPQIKF